MLNINHKFRSCIGKNKILSSNDNVLVCLTGGKSSAVLLDLISNGLSQDSHKKLRIVPFFLHITGLGEKENDIKVAELVIKQCQSYNFNVYIVNICEYYFQSNNTLPSVNNVTDANNWTKLNPNTNLKNILSKMTSTSSNDIEMKIKHDIFIRAAKQLKCDYIFTAETTTTLAVNLLSNLAIGRGSQVQDDIGFFDNRDENIKILRPMKDITEEELHHYIQIKDLIQISVESIRGNSLQSVIKTFVSDLQENFPATVSTLCKTADKIGSVDKNINKCKFCKSNLPKKSDKITAVNATIFSRTVSNGQPINANMNTGSEDEEDIKMSLFPFIDTHFCYCCSKNYLEAGLHDNNLFKVSGSENL
ncbi:unnamed protein product [Parnassius apollo]|uniref:Cytoplasmic tRNA 2-thiolation protein 2 n=1 Tax=Parnassius apollo TaxID=110799 RepID=A0A8S3WSD3_PARAO|nr:unnamed protein product [Parnassius apollo]